MSNVYFEFRGALSFVNGQAAQVYAPTGRMEKVVSTVSSLKTQIASTYDWEICTVLNDGTDTIIVQFGLDPTAAAATASANNLAVLAPGERRDFGPMLTGSRGAVINA